MNHRPKILFLKMSHFTKPFGGVRKASFNIPNHVRLCDQIFDSLGAQGAHCASFSELAWEAVEKLPSRLKLPRDVIRKKLGIPRAYSIWRVFMATTVIWGVITLLLLRFLDRKRAVAISLCIWVIATSIVSFTLLTQHKGSNGLKVGWLK